MLLDQENFATQILSSQGPMLVDFFSDYCAPCRALEPILRELAGDVPVHKVNIIEEPQLAVDHGVTAVPTVLIFKAGKEVARFVGLQTGRTLRRALDQARLENA
jgi:thioredoxin 1